jgi:crotonobetainyl-CoA:carnitine CoA-transferase CaiB-like acyl-CoA transferase
MKAPGASEFLDERIGNEVPVLHGGEDKLNQPNYLEGIRVIELADELGEYAGKVLAGLGADVIKVEAPTGETTRQYGPFAADEPGIENSLYFWHYNLGKRGIVLDLDKTNERDEFIELVQGADVLIDSRRRGFLASRNIGYELFQERHPDLIYARISPFGDDGPWADFQGSDLIHLALGGVAMNCGYDPEPNGFYETPPIAPQMWQSYHIAGEMLVLGVLGALIHRRESGVGQRVDVSVHEAVSKNTEADLPSWVFLRQRHNRRTCRHSSPNTQGPAPTQSKDGRWMLPYQTYLLSTGGYDRVRRLLEKWGGAGDLLEPEFEDLDYRRSAAGRRRIGWAQNDLIGKLKFDRQVWRDAQAEGLPWAPINRPEECIEDPHWWERGAFAEVCHPERGTNPVYVGARWYSPETPWRVGSRAPLLGEHSEEIRAELLQPHPVRIEKIAQEKKEIRRTPSGTPFAIQDVRVVDLSWFLASAGAGRFLAAFGADVIKVEHESRWDGMRWGQGAYPPGGRAQREAAESAIPTPDWKHNPNRGGSFMEINAGKRGLSLNLKTDRGKDILADLIRNSEVLIEGFTPGTLDRLGFDRKRLNELNPSLIYVQQSGLGQAGHYSGYRTFGPTAAAFSGISDLSGLPDPYPPAGIGYSYLDWFGAYNMATAVLAALYRRSKTGDGAYIDASQVEIGIYLTGTAVLDFSVNGREWRRFGNESPYKKAAPHGIFRCRGDDRWIAIAAFTDEHWSSVLRVLALSDGAHDPRFASLEDRMKHSVALAALVEDATQQREPFDLMYALQAMGVPAGVCQTAQDRYELDPQLAHLQWLTELDQAEIGRWPVKEVPFRMSVSPGYIGGPWDRSGPNYGQDTDPVLKDLLRLSDQEISELRNSSAI